MPYKRKYKRRRRRRNYKKRNYKKKYYPTPSRSMGPLSNTLKAKFIYEDAFLLDPGLGGTAGNYVFSANGLYDPNITGAGHQPRGFDELVGTLYDHYVVIGTKITVWADNTDTSNANMIALRLKDSNSVDNDPNDILEDRFVRTRVLGVESGGSSTGVVTMRCNPNKFLGRSKPLADPELKGSSAANPTEQAFFHVSSIPMIDGNDNQAVVCRARIEFTTILIEPRQPLAS